RAERATDERPVAFIRLETNPRCFVVNFRETVGRFTVEREHVASLRIKNDDRAVLSFQLVHRGLLQRTIDRETHLLIAFALDVLACVELEWCVRRAPLLSKQRALESWSAAIRSEDVGECLVHRIFTLDVAARVALVIGEWLVHTTGASEDPAAEGRF